MQALAPASRLLKLSSHDKQPFSASNSDFTVSFNNVRDISNAQGFIIKHVSFPNNFYNITATNNVFRYNDGADQTLVFPVGFYTVAQIIAYLTANGPPISYSQDPVNYKFYFVNTPPPVVYTLYDASNGSTISPFLGITSNIILPVGGSAYAQELPRLQGIEHVYIQSRILSAGNNMVTPLLQNAGYICMIPITVPFGSIVHYETNHEMLDLVEFRAPVDLREIDIKVVDANGNVLDMKGGTINIVLKVYTHH